MSPSKTVAKKAKPKALAMGQLPQHLGYALRRAQIAVFDDVIKCLARLDLRPAQYSVLLLIEQNPGCRQSQVAEALGIQRPNFVSLLDGLEKRKLAARIRAAGSSRAQGVTLTEQGQKTLREANAILAMHERRVAERIGADGKAKLLQLLAALTPT